jgi:riboflavin synthase
MFTGLVEAVGTIVDVQKIDGGARLRIETPLAEGLALGDSLAVNGVCLTATHLDANQFTADAGPETMRVTTLGDLSRESVVNLERPVRADSRMGGHFVQGHVDAVGVIEALRADGDFHWLSVRFPSELARYIVLKGSIAVDGISLTVAALRHHTFDVQLIPSTMAHTNLSKAKAGDRVNLECDMVGKYVAHSIEHYLAAQIGKL